MELHPFIKSVIAGCALSASLFAPLAHAVPTAYTDRTAFDTGVAALPAGTVVSTLNFDSLAAGTLIASGSGAGGITFTYGFGGVSLNVGAGYSTTSGANFLGTDDGDILQDGDDFNLFFAPKHAIGMYFISADTLFDGDITLAGGGGSASLLVADLQQTLSDGSSVFFLGLVDAAATFTSADVTTHGGGGAFLYNVDDIVTAGPQALPVPGTLALLGLGLTALWGLRPR